MKYTIDCSKQERLVVDDLHSTEIEVINKDKSILKHLNLNRICKISDLCELISIETLVTLRVANNNKIKNLGYLYELPNLRYLTIVNLPKLRSLDWLLGCPDLRVRLIIFGDSKIKPKSNLKIGKVVS